MTNEKLCPLREGYSEVSDQTFVFLIKDMIRTAVRRNHVCSAIDMVEYALDVVYPVVYMVVFNTNYDLRHNEQGLEDLINYLVTHLKYDVSNDIRYADHKHAN